MRLTRMQTLGDRGGVDEVTFTQGTSEVLIELGYGKATCAMHLPRLFIEAFHIAIVL